VKEFKGKVAVVTGGASGLGKAVVKKFLTQGSKTAILDINLKGIDRVIKESEKLGASEENVLAIECDVSDEAQVKNSYKKILRKFGRIDILHANAGISSKFCKMIDTTLESWNRTLAANLTGVFLTTKYAIIQMIKQNYGKVVITASNWALISDPGWASYAASKGGVLSYGRAIALEYGPYNINVNVICPGVIYSKLILDSLNFKKTDYDSIVSEIGNISKPEEIAELVLFLSSDRSSAMKGSVIFIDKGETLQYGKGIVNIEKEK